MFIRRAQGRYPPRVGWRWASGGVSDGGDGPGPVRGEEGLQQVEGGQLALIDMEGGEEGGFLTQTSEHGGGPRGSPLESGASPARALELAVQGVAGMARASGRVCRLVEAGEGERGEGFRSGGMGMGGGARPDSFPLQAGVSWQAGSSQTGTGGGRAACRWDELREQFWGALGTVT